MKNYSKLIMFATGLAFLIAGCKKEVPNNVSATSSAPHPAAAAPAATAAPAASTADTSGASADTTAKLAGAAWALKQDEIKNDAKGQWAIEATASSTYNDAKGQDSWSANQATGAPNVDHYADDGHAWTTKTQDSGIEWLDLKFPKPVHAEEVHVRESCGSGAVIKVEVFDNRAGAAGFADAN